MEARYAMAIPVRRYMIRLMATEGQLLGLPGLAVGAYILADPFNSSQVHLLLFWPLGRFKQDLTRPRDTVVATRLVDGLALLGLEANPEGLSLRSSSDSRFLPMAQGLTDHVWAIEELLAEVAKH
jgi:hypothetical protein